MSERLRPRILVGLALTAALALAGVVVAAAGDKPDLVLRTNGYAAQSVPLLPSATICQRDLLPSARFDGVRFGVSQAMPGQPGPAIRIAVRRRGRAVARGELAAGYGPQARQRVDLDHGVGGGGQVAVCFFNRSNRPAVLFGDAFTPRASNLTVDGKAQRLDLQLDLVRRPRTALSAVPDIARRASVERPGVVGPWLFWALGLVVIVGLPALLTMALARAQADRRP